MNSLYLLQVSSPLASVFIILQNSITPDKDAGEDALLYTNGLIDLPAIFFYTLIAIVVHAILQEYVLDVGFNASYILYLIIKSISNLIFIVRQSFKFCLYISEGQS